MKYVDIIRPPHGPDTAKLLLLDDWIDVFLITEQSSYRTDPCMLVISGCKYIDSLNIMNCDKVSADFRGICVNKFETHVFKAKDIPLMGTVRIMKTYQVDIGDAIMPECIQSLSCWSLPRNLPNLLELKYYKNPYYNIPESVVIINCHGDRPGKLPRNLKVLHSTCIDMINLREACPFLEVLSCGVEEREFICVEHYPTTLKKLAIRNYGDIRPYCGDMDLRDFRYLKALEIPFGSIIDSFIPPPSLDVISINLTYIEYTGDIFYNTISKIGYVNKLVIIGLTDEMFQVLKMFMFGTLFLHDMPCFDMAPSPFPVVALRSTPRGIVRNFKSVISIVNSPDNTCKITTNDNGYDVIKYSGHTRPYVIIGRETIDGINGSVEVIHSIDPDHYVESAKSARK